MSSGEGHRQQQQPPSHEKRTCTQCRKSKVKCDKNSPCSRCLRLGLNCVEQVRGRGRPLVSYILRPAEVETPVPKPAPPDTPQPTWHASLAFGNPERSLPAVQEFFADAERLARINRRKLLIVLRSWGLIARFKKVQSLFKTVQVVAQIFGLEIQEILNMEPEVYRELCEGGEKQELVFSPDQLPMYIKALDCDACAVSKRVIINGESRFYNNEMFSSMFLSSDDADRIQERATGLDVWMSCIDGDDRKEFFESCLSTTLVNPGLCSETSRVFKCKDRNGRTFLAIMKLRSVFLNAGDYVGYSFFINPIPPSRYVNTPTAHHDDKEEVDIVSSSAHVARDVEPRGHRSMGLGGGSSVDGGGSGRSAIPPARRGLMGDSQPSYASSYHYSYAPPSSHHEYPPLGGQASDHHVRDEGRWSMSAQSSGSLSFSGTDPASKRQRISRGGPDADDLESGERERHVAAALQRLYQQPTQLPPSSYGMHPGAMYGGSSSTGGSVLGAALESASVRAGLQHYPSDNYGGGSAGHLAMVAAAAHTVAAQQQLHHRQQQASQDQPPGRSASPRRNPTMRI